MIKKLKNRNGTYYARIRLAPTDRMTEISLRTRDKEVAQKKLNDLAQQMEREAAGLVIPSKVKQAAQLPLGSHLDAYLGEKSREWTSEKHYQLSGDRLKKLIRECGWKKVGDITAFSFTQWRMTQRDASKTLNDYLSVLKRFLKWLYNNGFIDVMPLETVERFKVKGRVFERKALSPDEIVRLLETTQDKMRRAVYTTAIYTGLRRAELEGLQWGDIHLDAEPPYLLARAMTTKNGKDAPMALHPAVVDAILSVGKDTPSPADNVFEVPPIETFKLDLAAAGIPYKDARGNKTDFHALRTTLCTLMHSSGVTQRTAQEIMRHSDPKLTSKIYTDASLLPTVSAIRSLPNFVPHTVPQNPTLWDKTRPGQSGKHEEKTFTKPLKTGLTDAVRPVAGQKGKNCRRRDSNLLLCA